MEKITIQIGINKNEYIGFRAAIEALMFECERRGGVVAIRMRVEEPGTKGERWARDPSEPRNHK